MEPIARRIIDACRTHSETDPIAIFNHIVQLDFMPMHGPQHHILDGACILTAFRNAGGSIDLEAGYRWIAEQGQKMPGAACGHWGVCGAVTSIGAALSFLDQTGPLSTDGTWGEHMRFTAAAITKMAEVNGPRCCKRDAYLSFQAAIAYINEHYSVTLTQSPITCGFSRRNQQCIEARCPFHPENS